MLLGIDVLRIKLLKTEKKAKIFEFSNQDKNYNLLKIDVVLICSDIQLNP